MRNEHSFLPHIFIIGVTFVSLHYSSFQIRCRTISFLMNGLIISCGVPDGHALPATNRHNILVLLFLLCALFKPGLSVYVIWHQTVG
jgi:hypothetical protein